MAKSKYETHVLPKMELISAWCRNGLTNEQIADNLGIGKTSFYKFTKEHNELCEVLKNNKEIADWQGENALYKKCLGFTAKIKKFYKLKEVKYSDSGKKIKETEKLVEVEEDLYIPPEASSQFFWLKNRKPDKWRDRQEIVQQGDMDITVDFVNSEELTK